MDVWETPMLLFNFAQKFDLATAAEKIFNWILIAKSSRQGIISIESQHTDQFSLTRTSSEESCEKINCNFL